MADSTKSKPGPSDDLDILGEIAEVEQLLPEDASALAHAPSNDHDEAQASDDLLADLDLASFGSAGDGRPSAGEEPPPTPDLDAVDGLPPDEVSFELDDPPLAPRSYDRDFERQNAGGAVVRAPVYRVGSHDSGGFPLPALTPQEGLPASPGTYDVHTPGGERVIAPIQARTKTTPPPPPAKRLGGTSPGRKETMPPPAPIAGGGGVRERTRGPLPDPMAPEPPAKAFVYGGGYDAEVEASGAVGVGVGEESASAATEAEELGSASAASEAALSAGTEESAGASASAAAEAALSADAGADESAGAEAEAAAGAGAGTDADEPSAPEIVTEARHDGDADPEFEALMGLSFRGKRSGTSPPPMPTPDAPSGDGGEVTFELDEADAGLAGRADVEVELVVPGVGEGTPPPMPVDVTDEPVPPPLPAPEGRRMSLAERLRRSGMLAEAGAESGETAAVAETGQASEAEEGAPDLPPEIAPGDAGPLDDLGPPEGEALIAAAGEEDELTPASSPPVETIDNVVLPEAPAARYVAELDRERAHQTGVLAAALAWEAQAVAEAQLPEPELAARLASEALAADPRFVPALFESIHRALAAGDPVEAQRLLATEAGGTPDGGRRSWIHVARARLACIVQQDTAEARLAYEAAIASAPKETAAQAGLERLALAAGDDALLLEVWKKLGIEVRTPERKALYLADFARTNERAGGDGELSIAALNRAFFSDPADELVIDDLRATARRHERWGDVVATLAKEVGFFEQQDGQSRAVAELHWRISQIYAEHLGEPESAWNSMEMALEFGPRHPLVLEAATRMARGNDGRVEEEKRAWRGLAGAINDPADRAAVLHELAIAATSRWSDPRLAETALRDAVAAHPPHRSSLLALERLFLREGRFADLAAALASAAPPADAPAHDRARHLVRLATVHHHHGGDTQAAAAAYRDALAAEPGYLPAVLGLARLLRAGKKLDELDAHLTASAAHVRGAAERWLHQESASLLAWELGQTPGTAERAIAALERLAVLDAPPQDGDGDEAASGAAARADGATATGRVADRLLELHERLARWTTVAELLERTAAAQGDARARAALLLRAARVREVKLDQTAAAAELYGRAHEAAPGSALAMAGLEAALTTLHDNDKLRAAWLRAAQASGDAPARAAGAYLRVAELAPPTPEGRKEAREALAAALELDPKNLTLLRALARQRAIAGDLLGAAALREREADATGDRGPARALALLLAASLRDMSGEGGPAAAAAAYGRVADVPDGGAARLWAGERAVELHAAAAEWVPFTERAGALVDDPELDRRHSLALQMTLGLVQELALASPDAARAHYEQALEIDAQNRAALRGLERVAEKQGQWAVAASAIERRAALTTNTLAAAQLHVIAAEHKLQGGSPGAPDNYRRALEVFPDHPDALITLVEHYRATRALDELEPILLRRAERSEGTERAINLVQLAEVMEEQGRLADARARYGEALAASPENLTALGGLRRAAQAAHDPAAVVEATQQLAKVVKSKSHGARLQREMARDLERLGRDEEAEKALGRALGLEPGDEEAFLHLRRLLRRRGDETARAALLERRLEHAAGPGERADLLLELADIQRRVTKKPKVAAESLQRAHDEDPTNLDVAELLGDVSCEIEEWGDAIEAYETLLRLTDDDARKQRANWKVAAIFETALPDPGRAIEAYRALRALAPEHTLVLERLLALHLKYGQHAEAAKALEARVALEPAGRSKVELLEHLAALYDRLGDLERAGHFHAEAYNAGPQHATGGARLAQLWAKAPEKLAEVLRGAVLAHRFALRKEPTRAETLKRLCDVLGWLGHAERRLWICDLLAHLAAADDTHAALARELRSRRPPRPARSVASLREKLVPEAGAIPLRGLMLTARDILDRAMTQELSALGVAKGDRDEPKKRSALRQQIEELAAQVGSGEVAIFRARLLGAGVLSALTDDGPALLVGPDALEDDQLRPEARFQAARALAAHAGGWIGLLDVEPDRAAALCAAIVRLGDPGFKPRVRADDLERAVDKVVSRKLRKAMPAEAAQVAPRWPEDFATFLLALHEEADRMALLVTGQLHAPLLALTASGQVLREGPGSGAAAITDIEKSPEALGLVKWVNTEEFFAVREELGLPAR